MHAENDDDLYGGQKSPEVKCGKLCDMEMKPFGFRLIQWKCIP